MSWFVQHTHLYRYFWHTVCRLQVSTIYNGQVQGPRAVFAVHFFQFIESRRRRSILISYIKQLQGNNYLRWYWYIWYVKYISGNNIMIHHSHYESRLQTLIFSHSVGKIDRSSPSNNWSRVHLHLWSSNRWGSTHTAGEGTSIVYGNATFNLSLTNKEIYR